jgi:hypothetical protein
MCPMRAICNVFKESPNALRILQSGVFWHYDIMSESQMWISMWITCIQM